MLWVWLVWQSICDWRWEKAVRREDITACDRWEERFERARNKVAHLRSLRRRRA